MISFNILKKVKWPFLKTNEKHKRKKLMCLLTKRA